MSHTDNRLANAAERQAASAEEIARQVTRAADAAVAAFQAMAPIIVQMTESLHRLGENCGPRDGRGPEIPGVQPA